MMRWSLVVLSVAVAASSPAAADISSNPQSAPKGRYTVDPPHAVVMFCIPHFGGTSNYCGWFPKVAGKLQFTGAQPANSKLSVTIDMTRVATRSDVLDQRLRDDFFEAGKFPTATFESTSAKVTGTNQGEVTGNLTIHGVTKSQTFKVRFNGGQPRPIGAGHVIGFSGEGTIRLADFSFGSVAWRVFVGDEVTLRFEVELVTQPANEE